MTTLSTHRPRFTHLCCAALALAAGQAFAQSSVLSSGLLHTSTGSATISPSPTGQGVVVQSADPHSGVSIQCTNTWGAGVQIDGSSLMQSDGLSRTVSCTFVPWTDPCAGQPENCGITASVRSNGNNTVTINVTSGDSPDGYEAVLLDQTLSPIATVFVPPSGLDFYYINCPDGSTAGHIWRTVWDESQQKFVSVLSWGCLGSLNLFNPVTPVSAVRFEPIQPSTPGGSTGISRCVVTAEGMSDVFVSDAQVAIRPPNTGAIGSAADVSFASGDMGSMLTPLCQADAACCEDCDDRDDSSLLVTDASGTGGPRATRISSPAWAGVSSTGAGEEAGMEFSQSCTDCTNQTTTIALHDDNGQTVGFDVTSLDAGANSHALSFDFGGIGASTLTLRAFSLDGTEVTPAGGFPIVNRQVFNTTNNPCPPGTIPTWTWWYKPGHGWLLSFSCWVNTNMVLPGGTVLTGVHHLSVSPMDALTQLGSMDHCEVTSQCDVAIRSFGPNPITTGGPACDSIDFNNDTSMFDPQDIDAFLSVYGEGPCIPETATCNDIDFNNDGSVFDPCDIDSFLMQFGEGPCTLCGV